MSWAAPKHADLSRWLLAEEIGGTTTTAGVSDAVERVFGKLCDRLARLISAAGVQALLSRALYLSQPRFPFLKGVRVGTPPAPCFEGLTECLHNINLNEAREGVSTVLGVLLDVLVGFIGEELTLRLAREVWPALPTLPLDGLPSHDHPEASS